MGKQAKTEMALAPLAALPIVFMAVVFVLQ
jgi:hypothetical protein